MKRREVLKGAVLGVGAALSSPAQRSAGTATAAAASTAEAGNWKPLLFDAHQNETVISLSELIVPATDTPGAKEAQVNRYIDLILHDGDPEERTSFLQGLYWLDGFSLETHQAPFVKLTSAQQAEILEGIDRAKDEELKPGARFFAQIKQLTVEGYYTSKVGIAELNKDGRVPETFGCLHEDHA